MAIADPFVASMLAESASAATSVANAAQVCASQAIGAVESSDHITATFVPWTGPKSIHIPQLGADRFKRVQFPRWSPVNLPDPPTVGHIDKVTADAFPTQEPLDFGNANFPQLGQMPEFKKVPPTGSYSFSIPNPPDIYNPGDARLLDYESIRDFNFNAPSAEFITPDTNLPNGFKNFDELVTHIRSAIFDGTPEFIGLTSVTNDVFNYCQGIVNYLGAELMEFLTARLRDPKADALPEQASISERMEERISDARRAADDRFFSGYEWRFPAPVVTAVRSAIEQAATAVSRQARRQVGLKSAELSLGIYELCSETVVALLNAFAENKLKQAEAILRAHEAALRYAKTVVYAAIKQCEIENELFGNLPLQLAETQLNIAENELKVCLFNLILAEARIKEEKSKQNYNVLEVAKYNSEQEQYRLEAGICAAQVSAAKREVELNKILPSLYQLSAKVFAARIEAYEAEIAGQVAGIEQEVAKAEQYKAIADVYVEKVDAFNSEINVKREILNAQALRNDAVISAYKAACTAALGKPIIELSEFNYELSEFETLCKLKSDELSAGIKQYQALTDTIIKVLNAKRDEAESARNSLMEIVDVELKKQKQISETFLHAASQNAGMAGEAIHAANAIASSGIIEEI